MVICIQRMGVKTDDVILTLTYQHVAYLHEETDNRKWKSIREPVHFWHYLIRFDPDDRETEVYNLLANQQNTAVTVAIAPNTRAGLRNDHTSLWESFLSLVSDCARRAMRTRPLPAFGRSPISPCLYLCTETRTHTQPCTNWQKHCHGEMGAQVLKSASQNHLFVYDTFWAKC